MIHEGPLLEYAGRDLALLEWSAAARHWLVLVARAPSSSCPTGVGLTPVSVASPVGVALLCVGSGLHGDRPGEDADPAGSGAARRRLPACPGRIDQLAGGSDVSAAAIAALVVLGFGVMLVRRRSLATVAGRRPGDAAGGGGALARGGSTDRVPGRRRHPPGSRRGLAGAAGLHPPPHPGALPGRSRHDDRRPACSSQPPLSL